MVIASSRLAIRGLLAGAFLSFACSSPSKNGADTGGSAGTISSTGGSSGGTGGTAGSDAGAVGGAAGTLSGGSAGVSAGGTGGTPTGGAAGTAGGGTGGGGTGGALTGGAAGTAAGGTGGGGTGGALTGGTGGTSSGGSGGTATGGAGGASTGTGGTAGSGGTSSSVPSIGSVSRNDALATASSSVEITGNEFIAGATLVFAGVTVPTSNCNYSGVPTKIVCTVPASGAVVRGDIVLTNPDGGSVTFTNGWTFTGVLNETNVAGEADFCDLQFPSTTTATANSATESIFGQIFEAGATDTTFGSPAPGVIAELGWGADGSDPTTANWSFARARFSSETGISNNNDEYTGTLTIPSPGTYSYAYRFSLDGGLNFTYCDQGSSAGGDGGSGSNGGLTFEANKLGTITVSP